MVLNHVTRRDPKQKERAQGHARQPPYLASAATLDGEEAEVPFAIAGPLTWIVTLSSSEPSSEGVASVVTDELALKVRSARV